MKGPLGQLSEAYKRLRHTRGHGVHSPFAYRTVKRVISPPRGYAWYGYRAIDEALEGNDPGRMRGEARMLLRLASELGVRKVYLPSPAPTCYRAALHTAFSGIQIISDSREAGTADLAVCIPSEIEVPRIMEWAESERCPALVLRGYSREECEWIFGVLPEGVMFYGPRNTLIIPHAGMQKVSYSASI